MKKDSSLPIIKYSSIAGTTKLTAIKGRVGLDLITTKNLNFQPEQIIEVGTDICLDMPENFYAEVHIRSSIGTKSRLVLANNTGIIDSAYKGQIMLHLCNESRRIVKIEAGDRVAQLIFHIIPDYTLLEVAIEEQNLVDSKLIGFGSTGRK